MVLEQKPFSVVSDKCLEIQNNAGDIEDNKLCLETLKARDNSVYDRQATVAISSATFATARMLASGIVGDGGTTVKLAGAVGTVDRFDKGFQQFHVVLTAGEKLLLTGFKSHNLLIVPVSSSASFDTNIITMVPTTEVQSDGTYDITAWTANFYAGPTASAAAIISVIVDIYVVVAGA